MDNRVHHDYLRHIFQHFRGTNLADDILCSSCFPLSDDVRLLVTYNTPEEGSTAFMASLSDGQVSQLQCCSTCTYTINQTH